MQKSSWIFFCILYFSSCSFAQEENNSRLVGGPCEGCEAIFEYGNQKLSSIDTLPGFQAEGIRIKVSGTVYQKDGKTPAEGVVLYVYHTNQDGLYVPGEGAMGWDKRHGNLRGWMKTDQNGQYSFYTLKPASYPTGSEPVHIHYTILEPDGKYYWLESCFFQGDPFLTRNKQEKNPRGGSSGILNLDKKGDLWTGTRDIILGMNIPDYD